MQEVYVKSIMNIIENINYLGRRYKRIWHSALYRIRNPVVAIISVRFRSSPHRPRQYRRGLFLETI